MKLGFGACPKRHPGSRRKHTALAAQSRACVGLEQSGAATSLSGPPRTQAAQRSASTAVAREWGCNAKSSRLERTDQRAPRVRAERTRERVALQRCFVGPSRVRRFEAAKPSRGWSSSWDACSSDFPSATTNRHHPVSLYFKMVSSSRRAQRKAHFDAPAHIRRKIMSASLNKELRSEHGVSMPLSTGCTQHRCPSTLHT